jgi:hypothetical protein
MMQTKKKKLTYKTGDRVLLSRELYCDILSYSNGIANFRVINGAWDGQLTDDGTMYIGMYGDERTAHNNVYVEYVFLPGEDTGHYNDVINNYISRKWYHGVAKYISYGNRLMKTAIKKYRIKLAELIDPRSPQQKFMDSDIPF